MKPVQWYIFFNWCYRLTVNNSKGLARKLRMRAFIISSIACRPLVPPSGYRDQSKYKYMKQLVEGICRIYSENSIVFCSREEIEVILRSGTLLEEEILYLMSLLPASIQCVWQPSDGELVNRAKKRIGHLKNLVDVDVRLSLPVDKKTFASLYREIKHIEELLTRLGSNIVDQYLTGQPSNKEVISDIERSVDYVEQLIENDVKACLDPGLPVSETELLAPLQNGIKIIKDVVEKLRQNSSKNR